jgi:HAD superfamily hydrolase (TIGR01450 family)
VHVICDLDGVIWLADSVIPGSPEAVAALRAHGHRVLFVSNNSFSPVISVEAKLARMGIPATGDVVTSAQAAATLIKPGETVRLFGGPGAAEAITAAGARLVDSGPADVVVVGYHRTFDYEELRDGMAVIRAGARFIATNDDATYPTPDGPIPGCGSIVAAFERASGVAPIIAGKPYEPTATLVRSLVGGDPSDMIMVGDRLDTDGLLAERLGCRFGLVLTGVVRPSDVPVTPTPDLIANDFHELAVRLLAGD